LPYRQIAELPDCHIARLVGEAAGNVQSGNAAMWQCSNAPVLNKCDRLAMIAAIVEYREFAPVPELATIVETLWTLAGEASALEVEDQPVLPDGRPELILHLGEPFVRVDGSGHAVRQSHAILAGQLTTALTLRPTGRIRVLGIRLRPYGAAALRVGPADRLLNHTIDVTAAAPNLARLFRDIQSATDDPTTAAAMVQQRLLRLLDATRIDARIRYATDLVLRRRGRVNIDRLAHDVNWSRRSLERGFQESVGIAPKRLARIARFQYALQVLEGRSSPGTGAHTAAACGYADQAHFVRDFRELAGCPPGAHLLRSAELMRYFIA
jgi:AraC-like DNA-binding protein